MRSTATNGNAEMRPADIVKSSLFLSCLYYMADGWRRRRRLRQGVLDTRSGARHSGLTIDQSLDYIEQVWRDYLLYSGRQALQGHVVEIGPGDNFGVALLLLRHGAARVTAIDKFFSRRDSGQQAAIYRALSDRHGLAVLFDGAPAEGGIRNFSYLPGMPAERYFTSSQTGYDTVVSRAVLEHLDDPLMSLDNMWAGLRPGGILVHRVDLRDHGMFAGRHPLTYLSIPAGIYRIIAAETGRPNRILLPAYRDHAAQRTWDCRFGITRLVGVPEEFPALSWEALPEAARAASLQAVAAIRPRLAQPFRGLADADLAVAGFVLVAEKARGES